MNGGRPEVAVVIPVKNGRAYLSELLDAVHGQTVDATLEVLVIDSGSTDGSAGLARKAGARVVEIAPSDFGHGRTRNLGCELTTGEFVVFLTQDSTPANEYWLAALLAAFELDSRVGMAFGPHLPRPDTSPMIARELLDFFGGFSTSGAAVIHGQDSEEEVAKHFLSNVNAAYRRACWESTRFRDISYAEDQAFARDAMAAGWLKAYVPSAAALHAHDYPPIEFMRRYYDEYRGLRGAVGHVEPFVTKQVFRRVIGQSRRDVAFAAATEGARAVRWAPRSALHHAGRAVFSALGSRSDRLPTRIQQRLSLEGTKATTAAPADAVGPNGGVLVKGGSHTNPWDFVALEERDTVPLAPASPQAAQHRPLHLAWAIPPFRAGSGGHMALLTIAHKLEQRGHSCSIWIHDPFEQMQISAAAAHSRLTSGFAPLAGGVYHGFDAWAGADVALATGWQTVYPLLRLPHVGLRAYFVQDFEPAFYPRSAESLWAEQTYELGLPCVCSSPWLGDTLRSQYGATADAFEYGVDFSTYHDLGLERDPDTLVFYARPSTPRRGTELGILTLAELVRRRPKTKVVIFGDTTAPAAPFDYEFLGVVDPARLGELYNRSAVGFVISLTNYSLIPKEMMACGLPLVDIHGQSAESVFGRDEETITFADPHPSALASALIALLDDPLRSRRLGRAARQFVSDMTWDKAAEQVEAMLRGWLAQRARDDLDELQREHELLEGIKHERLAAQAPAPEADVQRALTAARLAQRLH